MGFDQGQPGPVVNPGKKTTKVNLFVIAAIVVFFALGAYLVYHTAHHKPQSKEDVFQPNPAAKE